MWRFCTFYFFLQDTKESVQVHSGTRRQADDYNEKKRITGRSVEVRLSTLDPDNVHCDGSDDSKHLKVCKLSLKLWKKWVKNTCNRSERLKMSRCLTFRVFLNSHQNQKCGRLRQERENECRDETLLIKSCFIGRIFPLRQLIWFISASDVKI